MNPSTSDFQQKVSERFKSLPAVVQGAILSANIQQHLREMATKHKLHFDEWDVLENEVMLTLLGFLRPEEFELNIKNEIGISAESAHALASDINVIVFEPIRRELERQLPHPDSRNTSHSETETVRTESPQVGETKNIIPPPPTPPAPKAEASIVHAPSSGAYKPGEASSQRASVADDPYREAPL